MKGKWTYLRFRQLEITPLTFNQNRPFCGYFPLCYDCVVPENQPHSQGLSLPERDPGNEVARKCPYRREWKFKGGGGGGGGGGVSNADNLKEMYEA